MIMKESATAHLDMRLSLLRMQLQEKRTMFIMLNNEQKQHREESEKLTATINDLKISFADAINQQKTDMVTALNNNTLVLQKLIDKMDGK